MMVPTMKTLLVYKEFDKEIRVLCEKLLSNNNRYNRIESEIEAINPFRDDYDKVFECHSEKDGFYNLSIYENFKPTKTITVLAIPVLEFDGRIFEMKETEYDAKEYDF